VPFFRNLFIVVLVIVRMAGEPSHLEASLTDQLPQPAPRVLRIAASLSKLPVELVEPVLEDLPLFRVLELLTAPTCGPSLEWAIEHSPTWSWILGNSISRLKRVWNSLNRLAWLWCSTQYMRVVALPQENLHASCQELQARFGFNSIGRAAAGEHVRDALEYCVLQGLRRLLGCDLYNPRAGSRTYLYVGFVIPQLRALYLFIPVPILAAFKRRDILALQQALIDSQLPRSALDCLRDREDSGKEYMLSSADLSNRNIWTVDAAQRFLPFLAQANKLLKESYSAELLSMAALYEQFPTKLKLPFAPQTPPRNTTHVLEALQKDSKRVLTKPVRTFLKVRIRSGSVFKKTGTFRFRYPDAPLIPYDWCFLLFALVLRRYPFPDCASKYPRALHPALKEAEAGRYMIYHRNPGAYGALLQRIDHTGRADKDRLKALLDEDGFKPFLHYLSGAPKPLRELSWLKSFLTCIEWMEKAFVRLAALCQELSRNETNFDIDDMAAVALFPPPDYGKFVLEASPEVLASCLRLDSELCHKKATDDQAPDPSPLVFHLPSFSSPRGREIAKYLVPTADADLDIQQLMYDSLRQKITRYLKKPPKLASLKGHDDDYKLACELVDEAMEDEVDADNNEVLTHVKKPHNTLDAGPEEVSSSDLSTASRVLSNLVPTLQPEASAVDALQILLSKLSTSASEAKTPLGAEPASWDDTVKRYLAARSPGSKQDSSRVPRCYICRLGVHVPHQIFSSMCVPCGDFNIAGSELSLPPRLDLSGRTALVTGARVNLGYHVALRLLRCGAFVIASTRYPRDAISRYDAEPDSHVWITRLRVVGADFRSARDAFDLVKHTRAIIATRGGKLDILINNAAQTLTDSVKTEGQAVHRENLLKDKVFPMALLEDQQYNARVRGGAQGMIEGPASDFSKDLAATEGKSSWVQSISEIPYEDVISAHSVNTFVPLILIRELLPLMGTEVGKAVRATETSPAAEPPSSSSSSSEIRQRRPAGYIVNVSSREGIFESSPGHNHKAGHHVHTNMSKAALNMITETEAAAAWEQRRVAINTVDPGYMSAAPEMERLGARPIGWEDGAGRVLWPVAVGEGADTTDREGKGKGTQDGRAVWGRFLKHYGAVRVEPGWGRG
jgi:NAD(P)-dependent dehydrogenase (short-subunit alcohol dehydrogenase family)